jgi:O-antigen/teichoic acid export membrane protein
MTMVIFPKMASLDPVEAATLTARACRVIVIFSIVTIALILGSGHTLITLLYGVAYAGAVVPMYIVAFGVLAIGVTRVINTYLRSINRQEFMAYILVVTAVLNVALNFVLIPRFGIAGAALASLVTYTLQAAAMLVVFMRLSGVGIRAIIVPSGSDLVDCLRPVLVRLAPLGIGDR